MRQDVVPIWIAIAAILKLDLLATHLSYNARPASFHPQHVHVILQKTARVHPVKDLRCEHLPNQYMPMQL